MFVRFLKISLVCVISLLAMGCSNRSLEIEPNQVVYIKGYEEDLLDTFIASNKYVAYICIDASCSSCMTELQWWYKFIEEHTLLSPVFVINYSYNSIQPFVKYVRNIVQIEYPVLQDVDYRFRIDNKMNSEDIVLITKGWEVIFCGDPLDKDFENIYNQLKNN